MDLVSGIWRRTIRMAMLALLLATFEAHAGARDAPALEPAAATLAPGSAAKTPPRGEAALAEMEARSHRLILWALLIIAACVLASMAQRWLQRIGQASEHQAKRMQQQPDQPPDNRPVDPDKL